MSQDWGGMQTGNPTGDLKQQITDLGLQYRLMTQFTSFVTVDEMTITDGGQPKTVQVPVEMPDGVSREGVFGAKDGEAQSQYAYAAAPMTMQSTNRLMTKSEPMNAPTGYVGSGNGSGIGGGVYLGHRDARTSTDEVSSAKVSQRLED